MEIIKAITVYLDWKNLAHPVASQNYARVLKLFAEIAPKKVEHISMENVLAFNKKVKAAVSATTFSYYVTIIRGFLKYWNEEGIIKFNPSRIETPRYKFNPYHAVTDLEFHLIDDYLDTEPQNFAVLQQRLIIRLLWETGVRVSELCALKWRLIDQGKNSLLIETKKNEQRRWVFWSELTHMVLLEFIRQRRQFAGDTLIVTYEGPMQPKTVQRMIHRICKHVGLPGNIVPHSFRHGRAHHIIRQGGSVADVQQILGHKNPLSSHRYLQWNEEEVKERAVGFLK